MDFFFGFLFGLGFSAFANQCRAPWLGKDNLSQQRYWMMVALTAPVVMVLPFAAFRLTNLSFAEQIVLWVVYTILAGFSINKVGPILQRSLIGITAALTILIPYLNVPYLAHTPEEIRFHFDPRLPVIGAVLFAGVVFVISRRHVASTAA